MKVIVYANSQTLSLIVACLGAQFSFCRASVLWDLTELGVIVDRTGCYCRLSLTLLTHNAG